uniref:Uncharacterized protein n=1 Tax=Avena sativa TaxID=4498 RepID=A0ACD5XER2_AVESA
MLLPQRPLPLPLPLSSSVALPPAMRSRLMPRSPHTELPRRHVKANCGTSRNIPRISETESTITESSLPVQGCTAPLVQALKSTAAQDVYCFHFPGHNRGKAAPSSLSNLIGAGAFSHDLPELSELDDLFYPTGVILDAQNRAAQLFGSSKTWFLINGSTCGIQAAVIATCSPGDYLVIPRNCHISVISALVLSGAVPKYIVPEYNSSWDVAGGVTPLQVDKALKELRKDGKKIAAVLVTSPTYHGICSNVQGGLNLMACLKYIPLLRGNNYSEWRKKVDLAFVCAEVDWVVDTKQPVKPDDPVRGAAEESADFEKRKRDHAPLELAYSIDNQKWLRMIPGISVLDLSSFISDFPAIDPLRITLSASDLHLSGYEADDILAEEHRIVSELVGTQAVTFAVNLGTRRQDVKKLVESAKHLSEKYFSALESRLSEHDYVCNPFDKISMKLTPREAFFTKKRRVCIEDSLGEICGELICPYPPGIPVLIPGEVVTQDSLSYLINVRDQGMTISGAADGELNSIMVCNM